MNKRFLTALVLMAFAMFYAPATAQDDSLSQIRAAARQAMSRGSAARSLNLGDIITGEITVVKNFAFGQVIETAVEQGAPDFRLFMARRIKGEWQIALETSPQFYTWLEQSPESLMPANQRRFLIRRGKSQQASATRAVEPGNGAARLSLPFAVSNIWVYTGGPHSNAGTSTPPLSSVDFAVDLRQDQGLVRAAREGYVSRSSTCPNFIRVDHGDGWNTGYYHLINERVSNGQYVQRGQALGTISNAVGCGGWSSGPHVHFSVMRNGNHVSINGMDIGGWTIYAGSAAYYGTARRVRDGFTITQQRYISNDGSIGSGYVDKRYDVDRNGTQDLWAVNMRNWAVNKTSVSVASGNSPTTLIRNSQTSGLPVQPEYLNTAFAAADFNDDGINDLWVIHRLDGSGKTALRVMDGTAFYWLIADRVTALPAYNNDVAFAVADYNRDMQPDLWAITPRDPASGGAPRVQIASGASLTTVLVDTPVTMPKLGRFADFNYAAADYNLDGYPDLWVLQPRLGKTKSVGIRVISGRDWKTMLLDSGSALPMQSTNIKEHGFMVADYDGDTYPDVWLVNRVSGTLKVVSGRNTMTLLYDGASALGGTNSHDYHIIGSDRSREMIPPQAAAINPIGGAAKLINTPHTAISFKPAGLAETYTLRLRDRAGNVVIEKQFNDMLNYCGPWACNFKTQNFIPSLRDNQEYRVEVTTTNSYGQRTTNATFTTDIPGPATLFDPQPLVTRNTGEPLTLRWAAQTHANLYVVRVRKTDRSVLKRIEFPAAQCAGGVCTLTISDALPAGDYQWWVVSRNTLAGGNSVTGLVPFTLIDNAVREVPTNTPPEIEPTPEAPIETPVIEPQPTYDPADDIIPMPRAPENSN